MSSVPAPRSLRQLNGSPLIGGHQLRRHRVEHRKRGDDHGNPQNMLIGSLSGIAYLDFLATLAPVAVIGLLANWRSRTGSASGRCTTTSPFERRSRTQAVRKSPRMEPVVALLVCPRRLSGRRASGDDGRHGCGESARVAQRGSQRHEGWLALAMASTLAGNLTVTGSVANIIVVERAAAEGVAISFRDYVRVGLPVTVATLTLGIGWF